MTSRWIGRRVLVTGGAGVIGKVLVRALVARGANVLSVDVASDGTWSGGVVQHMEANLARGVPPDVCDFAPEVVFHLAATFERTVEEPGYWKTSFENNVLASHLLLRGLLPVRSLKIFVFASSYLVYKPEQYLDRAGVCCLKETDPIAPRNLVGLAKYFTERELELVGKAEGNFRWISARIFRVYGCGSRDVISRWIRAGLRRERIEVYGRENYFDFVFAEDVAHGLISLAESERAQGAINLGSGTPHSIDDVVGILRTQLGDLRVQDRECADPVEASCADMTLFRQITGWLPTTPLEQGIQQVMLYEKQRVQP